MSDDQRPTAYEQALRRRAEEIAREERISVEAALQLAMLEWEQRRPVCSAR